MQKSELPVLHVHSNELRGRMLIAHTWLALRDIKKCADGKRRICLIVKREARLVISSSDKTVEFGMLLTSYLFGIEQPQWLKKKNYIKNGVLLKIN